MKTQKLFLTLFAFVIISWPSLSLATSGCCSWHGGVSHCDTSVGRQVCSDGTYSPSCGCAYVPPSSKATYKPAIKTSVPAKDTTDYKALSASLKTQLDSANNSLKEANDEISEKNAKISNLTDSQDDTESWAGWATLFTIIFAISFFTVRSEKKEIEERIAKVRAKYTPETDPFNNL